MKVCMIAYAHYYTDARIKAYVKLIEKHGGSADILVLKEREGQDVETIGKSRIFYLMEKYQGNSSLFYILSYIHFFIRAFIKLNILYIRERYSAVHVHNMPNFIIFTSLVPRLFGIKVILDIHDLMPAIYMTKFNITKTNSLLKRMLLLEQRLSIKFATHVICADHMQLEYLRDSCDISDNKVTVIMNLPYDDTFKYVKNERNNKPLKLVYHGTIAKRLGIDILLRAVALVKNTVQVHVSIYGSGDFLEKALALKKELGLEENVFFSRSFFPVEKIPEIVSNMDVGVVPNRKNQATDRFMMPVKLMEYVFLQIPVIAPRLSIIKYYFDETMIKFFDPENIEDLGRCIVDLCKNPEERWQLVRNANVFFKKYNWKDQEKKYLKLLQ